MKAYLRNSSCEFLGLGNDAKCHLNTSLPVCGARKTPFLPQITHRKIKKIYSCIPENDEI